MKQICTLIQCFIDERKKAGFTVKVRPTDRSQNIFTHIQHRDHFFSSRLDSSVEISGQELFKDAGIKLSQYVRFLRTSPGHESRGSPVFADVVTRAGVDPGDVLYSVRRRQIQSVQLEGEKVEVESVGRDRLEHDRRGEISLSRGAVLKTSLRWRRRRRGRRRKRKRPIDDSRGFCLPVLESENMRRRFRVTEFL